MIVHNITTKVLLHRAEDWLQWQVAYFFPRLMASGECMDCKVYRLLNQEDDDGFTFTVQLFFNNQETYNQFMQQVFPVLEKEAYGKWRNETVHFNTLMQLVN